MEASILTDNMPQMFIPSVLDHYISHKPESLSFKLEKNKYCITINKIDLDIIRFLAENGPSSCFSIYAGPMNPRKRGRPPNYKEHRTPKRNKTKALAYDYKRILRHAHRLAKIGWLQRKKPKRKQVFALTFNGFLVYLRDRNKKDEHLNRAIELNSKFLPFAKYWSEIVQVIGKNIVRQGLARTVSQQIFRNPAEIEKINLEFDSFLVNPRPTFPQTVKNKLNKDFVNFLENNLELRNSYISYLATHDIFFLTSEKKWSEIDSYLSKLESEKALAFFEKRNIHDKPIFISEKRLREFFPRFATVEYFFTGMLMEKLLLKENRVDEYFSNDE
jgi:hypothetical protein